MSETRNKEQIIEESKEILENLKHAYQAKITKIMDECKNKLKMQIQDSQQKDWSKAKPETPIKMIRNTKDLSFAMNTREKNTGRTYCSTDKKTLINSPYLRRNQGTELVKEIQYKIDKFRAETEYSDS